MRDKEEDGAARTPQRKRGRARSVKNCMVDIIGIYISDWMGLDEKVETCCGRRKTVEVMGTEKNGSLKPLSVWNIADVSCREWYIYHIIHPSSQSGRQALYQNHRVIDGLLTSLYFSFSIHGYLAFLILSWTPYTAPRL